HTHVYTTMAYESTFMEQVAALLQKCYIIKRKRRAETMTEFLIGAQYVIILIVLKMTIPATPGQEAVIYNSVPASHVLAGMPLLGYVDLSSGGQAASLLNLTGFPLEHIKQFTNESAMLDTYLGSPEAYWGGVIFNGIDIDNNLINYTIRLNNSFGSMQSSPYPYIEQGILSAFTRLKLGDDQVLGNGFNTTQYPSPVNPFVITTFNILFPIYFPLFFMYSLQQLIILLVTEKKDGIKEGLKVMGMRESAYWISNIIMQLVMNIILILVMEIMCYPSKVIHYSSPVMVFISFFFYSLTLIGIAFAISTFLSNPKAGSAISALFILVGIGLSCFYEFYIIEHQPDLKYLFYLLSPCAFGSFLVRLSYAEAEKVAIPWNDPNFVQPLLFMILDFVLYSLIAWYSIEVYQGDFGTGKGYFFFLRKDYWVQSDVPIYEQRLINGEGSKNIGKGIELRDLHKEYTSNTSKDKKVRAVNGLSLSIPSGTIFALLGHNGAGKSTTMGILTGMMPPTSGDAWINGRSVRTQMDYIRKHIGFCPQNNILYAQLSCAEHLRLFGKIKGVPAETLEASIVTSLREVNLQDKTDVASSLLSGGMKRRLSLAMAFIGDPSIVFLDECTTGLDPYARHLIWELLQKKKIGRTIVMTTHFMEEAELLGESIGIMSHGKLRCMGTSMELKALFELGYILTFTLERTAGTYEQFNSYFMSLFRDAVAGKHNQANLDKTGTSSVGDLEISYSLSHEKSENLSRFFEHVEERQQEFGIKRLGISMTTLEEVFLKIQNEEVDT
ncbi:hypothetical protein SAMD00019534_029320, partial [Acytostelium subglobosum LB1]|uniref:hypothetical protein n=1 Tax=Acytostelium subglobosum LB1 TaxID=1410327 RepID=UPI0006450872